MTAPEMTREEYLTEAAYLILDDVLAPHHNQPTPKFRVSVGFPNGRKTKTIAQCFTKEVSADNHNEIFVIPTIDEPLEILAALTHELIHALDNCESGHKNFFAAVARRANLEGKLTATTAGKLLTKQLNEIIKTLPPYAGAKLIINKIKKQQTRMQKARCTNKECNFTFNINKTRTSQVTDATYCVACQNETFIYPTFKESNA